MSPSWSPTTKRIVLVGVIIFLTYAIVQFGSVLPALLMAIIFSYILQPFVEGLETRLRLPRTWAIIVVYLILIALLIVAPATLVPAAIQTVQKIPLDLQQLADNIADYLAQPVLILNYNVDLLVLYNDLVNSAQDFISSFAARTVSFIFDVAEVFVWFIFVLVVSFYLLKDVDDIVAAIDKLVPPDHLDEFRKLRHEVNDIWRDFFRAQLIQCLVVGTIVGVVMAVVGVQDALVLAAVAALFETVPTIGHTISAGVGVLFAFFQGPSYHHMPNILFALGRRLHLHPLVVIVGLIAGAAMGGVLGVFMATPVLSTIRVLGRYVHRKLLDMDPYPDSKPPEETIVVAMGEKGPRWLPAQEIEAVLFDLDGTLIDIDDQQIEALAHRLRGVASVLPDRDLEQAAQRIMRKAEGPVNAVLTALDVVGLDDNVLDLEDRLRRFKGERTEANFEVVPGAAEALRALDGHYRLGIVTTRGQRDTEAFLVQYQLTDLFEVVVTRESTPRLKPHPQPVRYAAEMLGLSPERCVMVGDTTVDMEAAKKAGARAIAVLCGFGEREELEAAGADIILESTARLGELLI
jgi:HAD superfamily hydrolase (TIGR01549 family)